MPILVECPGCGARLNAPDAGAGKKVRCPKPNCGSLIPVPALLPAEEVVEAEEAPPPRQDRDDRPRRRDDDYNDRPRGRRRDEEDDRRPVRRRRDEDAGDDRPRRDRDQPRRKRGMGTGTVIAVVLGSVLVLAAIGYGVYAMLGGSKTAVPPGWKEYVYKDDGFKAYFPKEPQVERMGDMMGGGGGGFPGFGGMGGTSMNMYSSGDSNEAVHIQVMVFKFPSNLPSGLRNQMAEGFRTMPGVPAGMGVETKSVRWMGESATELAMPGVVMRIAITDKAMYQVTITGKNGRRATPEDEKAFFDNFVPAR